MWMGLSSLLLFLMSSSLLLLLINSNVVALVFNKSETRTAEFCERQTFAADCTDSDRDKVVVMVTAKYGRMRPSTCLSGGASNSNCEVDVLDQFDLWCSGRRSCQVRVSSIIDSVPDHEMVACLREFRGFLEASYACVSVVTRTPAQCNSQSVPVQLTEPSGYIANVVTDESGCGSVESPWILQAPSGQTIHLRLIDFAFSTHDLSSPRKNCDVYLIIKEKSFSAGNTICSIEQKEQSVYLSEANRIEVRVVAGSFQRSTPVANSRKKYFLLKYTLQGCADIPSEKGRWVERLGSVAIVGCNGSSEKFQLTCQSNAWVGELNECSASYFKGSAASMFWSIFTDSQWIAIATILGIALIIGVMIFLAGIICIRRRRQVQSYVGQICSSPRCMAEYHLTRCVNDPTGLSRHGTPKSLSLDLLGGASLDGSNVENDYFRTWQLQRNAFNNLRCPNIPSTFDASQQSLMAFKASLASQIEHGMGSDGFRNQSLPLVEHIYESPKFDRKDLGVPDCYAGSNQQTTQNPESLPMADDADDVTGSSQKP